MNNQVARLREEISVKELALAKDEQEHKRLDKDNEALKVLSSALSVAAHTLQLYSLICLSRREAEYLRMVDQVCWPAVFLQGELQLVKLQLEETKQRVDSQRAEQHNLQKMLADADAEHTQQKKQTEQVKKEKLWCREKKMRILTSHYWQKLAERFAESATTWPSSCSTAARRGSSCTRRSRSSSQS